MPKRRKGVQGKYPAPKQGIDFPLILATLAILAFGLIMVLTAGSVRSFNTTSNQNSFFYVMQQLKWAILGGGVAFLMAKLPYRIWRRFSGIVIVLSVVLLVAVLFTSAGQVAKGSARWLKMGPVNVQPSEIAKLAVILFLAHVLDRFPVKKLRDFVIPGAFIILILGLVYKQPDLGTTMVIAITVFAMLWQTQLPTRWFLIAIPSVSIPLFYLIRHTEYQWNRILAWMDPWKYASDLGYQITNAQIAFGSGGIFGVGLGHSLQKYGFLPETYTDMIFAVIGEELGLIGTLFLIGLFVVLYARGFYIARQCEDRFGRLLAFGVTTSLAVQTGMNLAVVTGVMPVTGVTLPLVSYGGSSLVITLAEIGILMNISCYARLNTDLKGIIGEVKSISQ
ncbi:putative lipid II flippase FtsW [Desulfitobacterium metallireducens]|uniref:Probable peptidoglycan glycosyltransferase FtsW n=1 Tax=Desulfitobacterium metallireducens DSM 15288 TaxID=871968 RepID=W0E955_9FIRM|nr:putative lipid II flippase FtsW [Desulfitobacterium metallireducens]AHF07282.1 cell division protein FtsW [Desulfitobacterium metallireducens DSM 15288]